MAGTNHDKAAQYLRNQDDVLRSIIGRVGPCTLAPSPDYFLTLVEAIVWQQLSWKAALTIHQRLLDALGTRAPRPDDFVGVRTARLRAAGLSKQKVIYLRALSAFFRETQFDPAAVKSMGDEEVVATLTAIKGIGTWTAEMFLIFALNRPDVFPGGDLALQKAIGRCYGIEGRPEADVLERITSRWSPYRTIGSWYLWHDADTVTLER